MRRPCLLVALAAVALAATAAHAQKTTEIFIPIGRSPGVSGISSVIGTIDSYDADAQALRARTEEGDFVARLTERTKIWLDRSAVGSTNVVGSPTDFRAGRRCEIKFVYDGATRTEEAEWIKVEVLAGQGPAQRTRRSPSETE